MSSLLGPFGGGTDPADLLASLTAISSSVTNLGTTTIRGVPVTGFRGEYRPGEGGRPGPALGACGLSIVATQLPEPATKDNKPAGWVIAPPFGFVTVTTVGGGEDELLPAKRPVMQVDCWSTRPGSNKPPWERANRLAEHISAATRDRHRVPRPLAISSRGVVYPSASVQRAALMTRPGRIWDDAGDMARYQFDLQLQWITLAEMLG